MPGGFHRHASRALTLLVIALALVGAELPAVASHEECDYGRETVPGTDGDDVLLGSGIEDLIRGRSGNDRIRGFGEGDSLCGGVGNDIVDGGDEDDFLNGGAGNDVIRGGTGRDNFAGQEGDDSIDGGPGHDTLGFHDATGPIQIDLEAGIATGQGTDQVASIEEIFGSDFGGTMIGSDADERFWTLGDGPDVIRAGDGDDYIVGQSGEGDDILEGEGGNDEIEGYGYGTDVLRGGPGNDRITAYEGDESLEGGDGDDQLRVGDGRVTIDGGAGRDLFGFDTSHGDAQIDLEAGTISGTARGTITGIEDVAGYYFKDTLLGDEIGNVMRGGARPDVIDGRGGDDQLVGGGGSDILRGNDGDDELIGAGGVDDLDGGPGIDSCSSGETTDDCEVIEILDDERARGPLDVVRLVAARQVLNGEVVVQMLVITDEPWETSELRRGELNIRLDYGREHDIDRTLSIEVLRSGRLVAVLERGATSHELGRLPARKAGGRGVVFTFDPASVGNADQSSYRFRAESNSSAPGCTKQLSDVIVERCLDITSTLEHSLQP